MFCFTVEMICSSSSSSSSSCSSSSGTIVLLQLAEVDSVGEEVTCKSKFRCFQRGSSQTREHLKQYDGSSLKKEVILSLGKLRHVLADEGHVIPGRNVIGPGSGRLSGKGALRGRGAHSVHTIRARPGPKASPALR